MFSVVIFVWQTPKEILKKSQESANHLWFVHISLFITVFYALFLRRKKNHSLTKHFYTFFSIFFPPYRPEMHCCVLFVTMITVKFEILIMADKCLTLLLLLISTLNIYRRVLLVSGTILPNTEFEQCDDNGSCNSITNSLRI